MTPPTDPRDPIDADADVLDALASTHLDGRTTPAEAERIAADADLAARVAAMAAARAAVRAASAPIDAARREAAIAAALAAYDADGTEALELGAHPDQAPGPDPALPIPLAARRPERRSERRRWQLLGAAAAAAVLVATGALLGSLGSTDEDVASTGVDDRAASTLEESAGDVPAAVSEGTGAPLAADAASEDLGTFLDVAALADHVRSLDVARQVAPSTTTTPPGAAEGFDSSAGVTPGCPGDGSTTRLLEATATVGGAPVVVVVEAGAGGENVLRVLDAVDCTEAYETTL